MTVSGPGIVTAGISTSGAIGIVTITSGGNEYAKIPTVVFSSPNVGWGITAIGEVVISAAGTVSQIRIINSGLGYTQAPTITIGSATTIGQGSYSLGEEIVGSSSSITARVKSWDASTSILELGLITEQKFQIGELVTGRDSGAVYTIESVNYDSININVDNDEIEVEADSILDFDETNPFGTY